MASLKKSRTLFFPTSPRSPYKLSNEIKLLIDNLAGKPWNVKTQKKYASLLTKADFFEGQIKANDDFAARDRITRAPKALGFVDLKPIIRLTDAGKQMLKPLFYEETFIRQLMKFQLPSAYHLDKDSRYLVKPYLEILRLIFDLNGLTKTELSIFGMQLINFKKYPSIKQKIIDFRIKKSKLKHLQKKKFIAFTAVKEITEIFRTEIESGKISTRANTGSSIANFLRTKHNNLVDYADSCIRYLRATGLVKFDLKTRTIIAKEDRLPDIIYLLKNIPREPELFESEQTFKDYLFSMEKPILLSDSRDALINSIKKIANELSKDLRKILPNQEGASLAQLKELRHELEHEKLSKTITQEKIKLQTFTEFDDIIKTYTDIEEKDVVDPSLFLEWNTWRAMAMLDDGEINGNFKSDTDGSPMACAAGNSPDIECRYASFNLIVEVTRSSGQRQYEMEGEPVARHLGLKRKAAGGLPTYCLFIAPTINDATLAHFYALHRISLKYYGGKSHIIPMDIDTFILLLKHAKEKKNISSTDIKKYLDFLVNKASEIPDEDKWFTLIKQTAPHWTSCFN